MHKLQIRWQYAENGIRILQIYGDVTCIYIPEAVSGTSVTEIGPYCFSTSEPRKTTEPFFFSSVTLDRSLSVIEEQRISINTLPALNGKYIEEIMLPPAICVLHNAAFYNCRKLRTLAVGPLIHAIGSDVFTNCFRLTRLLYQGKDADAAALSLVLGRIETDLDVIFIKESLYGTSGGSGSTGDSGSLGDYAPFSSSGSSVFGALFFPEYYEWLNEVSPAHLFSRSIHGEGFRMRRCFQNGQIDYGKYDACFENALKTETEKTLCRIALNRLLWPNGLQASPRTLYEDTINRYFDTALSMAVQSRQLSLLNFLFTGISPALSAYTNAIDKCIGADWGEGAAFVMEQKHLRGRLTRKTYDFDDL